MRAVWTIAIFAALALAEVGVPARSFAAGDYAPPTNFGSKAPPDAYFALVKSTGHWCVATPQKWKQLVDGEKIDASDYGWIRFENGRPVAITYAQASEDAFAEDRYLVGPDRRIEKMIRTGHYINDPWASLTFEPDAEGRLRLSAASNSVLKKMDAAGYETYPFVKWSHFSRLDQIPFEKLIDIEHRSAKSTC